MLTHGQDLSLDYHAETDTLVFGLHGRLWQTPVGGGNAKSLTAPTHALTHPRISPDGKQVIAVGGTTLREHNLWLIDIETQEIRRLSDGPWRDANPCWHPTEPAILFESDRSGQSQIWKQRTDDADIQRVTFEPGEAREPSFIEGRDGLIYVQTLPGRYEVRQRYGQGRPTTLVTSSMPIRYPQTRRDGVLTTFWQTNPDGTATLEMLLPTEQTIIKSVPELTPQAPQPIRWQDRDHYFVVNDGYAERRKFASSTVERVPLTAWQTVKSAKPLPIQPPSFSQSPRYVLKVGFVADVVTGRLLANQDVLIDEGRIVSVEPARDWPNDTVIEFPASTLMPSMIDIEQDTPPDRLHKAAGIVATLAPVSRLRIPEGKNFSDALDMIDNAPPDTLVHGFEAKPYLAFGLHLVTSQPSSIAGIEPMILASSSYLQIATAGMLPRDNAGMQALTESRLFTGSSNSSRTLQPNAVPVSVYSRLIATAEHSGFASPLGLHANLIALNELGVPNVELIAAATLRPATLLGMSHHGLVENGFVADLILIDGNPFEDIRTLLQPIAIVDQGVLRSVEGLLNP
ncbi:MAG: hypothetical protein AAGL69_09130 [Pseudomonadota bacterium]